MNFLYTPDGLKITVKAFLRDAIARCSESFPVEGEFRAGGTLFPIAQELTEY
jgi:hypothetical protein